MIPAQMSPSWARKGSKRWRYYVSQAALQGDKGNAGSIERVPPANVEALVVNAVSKLSSTSAASQTDIRGLIDRLVTGRASIQIQLSEVAEAQRERGSSRFPGRGLHPIASKAARTRKCALAALYLSDTLIASNAFDPGHNSRSESSLSGRSVVPRTSCSSLASSSM